MCSAFLEEYNQFFEYENDISSISSEKSYMAKLSLDAHAENYLKSFNYWENPSKEAKKKYPAMQELK